MIDVQPPPVPELGDEWIAAHRTALVDALSPRHRARVKWLVVAGATGAAATVATLFVVGGTEQSAFAGWSATPTAPASGQVSTAEAACASRLGQVRPSNKGTDAAGLVPELSDVRGPYTVTVFGNGMPGIAMCVSAPDATSLRWLTRSTAQLAADTVAVDQTSILTRDSQAYTLVEGRTGDGVTSVVLTLGNGANVTATVGKGVFVAWWPGSQSITSATVTTATGASIQTLNVAGPGNPPSTKSSPSPASTQSSDGVAHITQSGPAATIRTR